MSQYKLVIVGVLHEEHTLDQLRTMIEETYHPRWETSTSVEEIKPGVVIFRAICDRKLDGLQTRSVAARIQNLMDVIFYVSDLPEATPLEDYVVCYQADGSSEMAQTIDAGLWKIVLKYGIFIEYNFAFGYVYCTAYTKENLPIDPAIQQEIKTLMEAIIPGSIILEYPTYFQK